jgi:nicotinamide-nucleotide amidase
VGIARVDRMSPSPPLRRAEIIAVGSELLGSVRLDTNSLFITDRLAALGISVRAKSVVGDDRDDLAGIFSQALARADLIVLTGGLGPTADDLTREVVAGVLGLPLEEDPAIVEVIERRFARRGLRMPDVNRRQAMVPRGATVLDNPNGTAPGLLIDANGRMIALLPGPPRELQPMVETLCAGRWLERAGRERLFKASLFVTGRGESHVEEIAQPIYSRWAAADPPIETTILASPGLIELHLTLRSADAVDGLRQVEAARNELAAALGADVFGTDGRPLEEIVGERLRDRGLTIAAAESCTGGLFMSRLTDVPGSSAYVRAGVVVYSNETKTSLAGVPAELIAAHGAVSEPVAMAMAQGIRERAGSTVGIGISGIAGPGGATPGKPVGTVVIAMAGPGELARARTFSFPGGRLMVKFQAAQAALDMIRRTLS